MKYTRLGDLLVDAGVITDETLATALAQQKETKKRLGEQLIDSGAITERQLIGALTRQLGIEFVDLSQVEIAPEMTQLVSKNMNRISLFAASESEEVTYMPLELSIHAPPFPSKNISKLLEYGNCVSVWMLSSFI